MRGQKRDLVVIGGSAGSLEPVLSIVRNLPGDFPAALCIAIHVGANRSVLPEILVGKTNLPSDFAIHGEPLRPGRIYVAPSDNHLTVQDGQLNVVRGPRENGQRPAIDPLFRSAATHYGNRVVGVVLSGLLDCGSHGLKFIKAAGGMAIVQDPLEAAFPDMPRNALATVTPDYVLRAESIAETLVTLTNQRVPASASTPSAHHVTQRVDITCPECHGALLETDVEGLPEFQCHVGHLFTLDGLLDGHHGAVEAALWNAVRALREHEALTRRAAARVPGSQGQRMLENARMAHEHAALIESFLVSSASNSSGRRGGRRSAVPNKQVGRRTPSAGTKPRERGGKHTRRSSR